MKRTGEMFVRLTGIRSLGRRWISFGFAGANGQEPLLSFGLIFRFEGEELFARNDQIEAQWITRMNFKSRTNVSFRSNSISKAMEEEEKPFNSQALTRDEPLHP